MTDTIKAEKRTEFGKGAARRIRRDSKVPAVLYGHGGEPQHLTLPGHDTMLALKHGGTNAVLEIEVDGKKQLALTKQVQSDPIKGFLEHIDFVIIKKGEKVTVDVVVQVEGEAKPDALVTTLMNTLSVEADATHIPEYVTIDVTDAEPGTQFLAGQVALPDGAVVLDDDETLVVNVGYAPTAEEVEAELEAAEEEAGIERDESDEEAAEAAEGEGSDDEAAAESGDSEGSED